ncbi:hypothetical protein LIER_38082 [Lithospermum erythrorhizon]|uniref:Secreted protein n=1 Tax=Lithospermum erythrorhizon TaxID=34254 RepID=A0AAV3PYZ5_LITER
MELSLLFLEILVLRACISSDMVWIWASLKGVWSWWGSQEGLADTTCKDRQGNSRGKERIARKGRAEGAAEGRRSKNTREKKKKTQR